MDVTAADGVVLQQRLQRLRDGRAAAYGRETGEGTVGLRIRIIPAFVEDASAAVVGLAERLEVALL